MSNSQPVNELLIKEQPRAKIMHFQNNNFKHRLSIKFFQ